MMMISLLSCPLLSLGSAFLTVVAWWVSGADGPKQRLAPSTVGTNTASKCQATTTDFTTVLMQQMEEGYKLQTSKL